VINLVVIELNNQFGPYGNYDDGEKRALVYNDNSQFLAMIEDEWFTKGHFLYVDTRVTLDNKKIRDGLTKDQFDLVAFNIVSHPRNKVLLLYTMGEMNKQFPGIREFIGNNFPLYNSIVDSCYSPDPFIDSIVEATIHEKCNLKGTSKNLLKK